MSGFSSRLRLSEWNGVHLGGGRFRVTRDEYYLDGGPRGVMQVRSKRAALNLTDFQDYGALTRFGRSNASFRDARSGGAQISMRICSALGLILLLALTDGCEQSRPVQTAGTDDGIRQYGYGPQPNRKVRYQPDVIMIGGGAKAIRGVSDDDLTWTIDANAEGADQLRVGKIMFVTSRAVGRVTALEPRGKNLVVTLGPVQFTEVVRDAVIDLDTALDSKLLADEQSAPLVPQLAPAGEQDAIVRPTVWRPSMVAELPLAAGEPDAAARPAVWRPNAGGAHLQRIADKFDVNKDSLKVKVGSWEIEPYWKLKGQPGMPITEGTDDATITEEYKRKTASPDYEQKARDPNVLVKKEEDRQTEFGLKALYNPHSWGGDPKGTKPDYNKSAPAKLGLKFGYSLRLSGEKVHIRSHLAIADGKVNGPVTFVIDGIDRMHLGFYGGAENGVKDNISSRIEVPSWEKAIPFTIDGIPMALHLKFKFLVETAFSGGNSSMWAGGDYKFIGPVGLENGAFVSPTIVVVKPMSENMHGLTIGVAGLVVATEFRFLLGFGNRAFVTGPYSKTIITFATAKGSYLGFYLGGPLSSPFGALAQCRGIKVKGDTGGGVGIVIDKEIAPDFIVAKLTELELFENMGTFFDKSYRFGCPTADK